VADIGYIESELGGVPADQKRGIVSAFRYTLNAFSFAPLDKGRATNAQLYYLNVVTSSNANEEFSVAHGLDAAPSYLIPVLRLNEVGSQLVPLQVSKAPDGRRVYLKSSSTSAAISVMVG
jgi:hypothetical protein